MKWNELIGQIMQKNKGMASLNFLYEQAPKYKDMPKGDWQKTLRGVLYREVNKGKFKKIGLGVYALPEYRDEGSAYSNALKNIPATTYLKHLKDQHSAIEGMLIEIGNFFGYLTYSSDLNKSFDGKKLSELCGTAKIPEFTYAELKEVIRKSDTVWLTKTRLPFPKYVFEVESTTDFSRSLLKMFQLINFDARFVLVATESRKHIYTDRISKEPFADKAERFLFRSFEAVSKLYFNSVEHYELKFKFL